MDETTILPIRNVTLPPYAPGSEWLEMKDVHRGTMLIWLPARGTVFVDIDGTLADLTHRRVYVRTKPKNWSAFERAMDKDTPIDWVIDAVRRLYDHRWTVILMSGRNEKTRKVTEDWLKKYGVSYHGLYMRPDKDYRADDIVKEELLAAARADGYDPDVVFDDRDRVVAMWRSKGIPVVQVAEGDF